MAAFRDVINRVRQLVFPADARRLEQKRANAARKEAIRAERRKNEEAVLRIRHEASTRAAAKRAGQAAKEAARRARRAARAAADSAKPPRVVDPLTELGIKYGTDKAFDHKFTEDYNRVFEPVRFDVTSVLEIGVCKGRSIRMWLDYFPNATIWCIDSMDVASFVQGHERVRFHQCSQSEYRTSQVFDIIIDDGSHLVKDQQDTFTNLLHNWQLFYVVEDLHTSNSEDYGFDGTNSTIDFLRDFQRNNESRFNIEIIKKKEDSITSIISRK